MQDIFRLFHTDKLETKQSVGNTDQVLSSIRGLVYDDDEVRG